MGQRGGRCGKFRRVGVQDEHCLVDLPDYLANAVEDRYVSEGDDTLSSRDGAVARGKRVVNHPVFLRISFDHRFRIEEIGFPAHRCHGGLEHWIEEPAQILLAAEGQHLFRLAVDSCVAVVFVDKDQRLTNGVRRLLESALPGQHVHDSQRPGNGKKREQDEAGGDEIAL